MGGKARCLAARSSGHRGRAGWREPDVRTGARGPCGRARGPRARPARRTGTGRAGTTPARRVVRNRSASRSWRGSRRSVGSRRASHADGYARISRRRARADPGGERWGGVADPTRNRIGWLTRAGSFRVRGRPVAARCAGSARRYDRPTRKRSASDSSRRSQRSVPDGGAYHADSYTRIWRRRAAADLGIEGLGGSADPKDNRIGCRTRAAARSAGSARRNDRPTRNRSASRSWRGPQRSVPDGRASHADGYARISRTRAHADRSVERFGVVADPTRNGSGWLTRAGSSRVRGRPVAARCAGSARTDGRSSRSRSRSRRSRSAGSSNAFGRVSCAAGDVRPARGGARAGRRFKSSGGVRGPAVRRNTGRARTPPVRTSTGRGAARSSGTARRTG